MPNNQYNTTFNRGNANGISPGFYSRTLFTWTNQTEGYDLASQSEWISNDNGDGLQLLVDNKSEYCHGGFTFPPNYWISGKTIRFRGTFGANSDDTNQIFNMRFGLKEAGGPTTVWLAAQNNFNDHTFATGEQTNEFLPINFQCLLMHSIPNFEGFPWFTANGFYKYNRVANSASTNTAAIQVPVWGYGSGPNGIAASVSTDYINNQTSLMMNCYGSTVASLQLLNLTIEELL